MELFHGWEYVCMEMKEALDLLGKHQCVESRGYDM